MKYNLRNLLWHMKYKGKEDEVERIADCKKQLYDAVQDNIDYFRNYGENCLYSNNDIFYSVSMSQFKWKLTLDKLIEIEERFNKAATGLFGLTYDNSAKIVINDLYGNPFITHCYYDKHDKSYELCVYDISGHRCLYKLKTKDNKLTQEQFKELEKCHSKLLEQYEKEKESSNRYKQICQYKDYIRTDNYKNGYAHYTCDVYVRKDIPIDLTEHEIVKFIDNWNYCFGGHISAAGETETERKYKVKVHTD